MQAGRGGALRAPTGLYAPLRYASPRSFVRGSPTACPTAGSLIVLHGGVFAQTASMGSAGHGHDRPPASPPMAAGPDTSNGADQLAEWGGGDNLLEVANAPRPEVGPHDRSRSSEHHRGSHDRRVGGASSSSADVPGGGRQVPCSESLAPQPPERPEPDALFAAAENGEAAALQAYGAAPSREEVTGARGSASRSSSVKAAASRSASRAPGTWCTYRIVVVMWACPQSAYTSLSESMTLTAWLANVCLRSCQRSLGSPSRRCPSPAAATAS